MATVLFCGYNNLNLYSSLRNVVFLKDLFCFSEETESNVSKISCQVSRFVVYNNNYYHKTYLTKPVQASVDTKCKQAFRFQM